MSLRRTLWEVSAQQCTQQIPQKFRKEKEDSSLGYFLNDLSKKVGNGRIEIERRAFILLRRSV